MFYILTYSFLVKVIAIFIYLITNSNFDEKKFNIFIIITTVITDIFACLGILIYCEVIELNFCNLNYNLRRNIIARGEKDLEDEMVINEQLEKNEYMLEEIKDGKTEEIISVY